MEDTPIQPIIDLGDVINRTQEGINALNTLEPQVNVLAKAFPNHGLEDVQKQIIEKRNEYRKALTVLKAAHA